MWASDESKTQQALSFGFQVEQSHAALGLEQTTCSRQAIHHRCPKQCGLYDSMRALESVIYLPYCQSSPAFGVGKVNGFLEEIFCARAIR
jgi:hypothetical protein